MANKYAHLAKKSRRESRKIMMCDRKKGYQSEREAQAKGARVYRCKHCGLWHRTRSLISLTNRGKRRK